MYETEPFILVDVAKEIIWEMIADVSIALEKETNSLKRKELKEKLKIYKLQRKEIYLFNMATVKCVIDTYGPILRAQR